MQLQRAVIMSLSCHDCQGLRNERRQLRRPTKSLRTGWDLSLVAAPGVRQCRVLPSRLGGYVMRAPRSSSIADVSVEPGGHAASLRTVSHGSCVEGIAIPLPDTNRYPTQSPGGLTARW